MAAYSTILGGKPDYVGVVKRIREMSAKVDVTGLENAWTKIICNGPSTTVTFNSMRKIEPGDAFSRLILSTHNFFRTRVKEESEKKDLALRKIKSCALAVGVVAEPDLSEEDENCLLDLTRLLEGVIFNGSSLIDSEGQLIVGV